MKTEGDLMRLHHSHMCLIIGSGLRAIRDYGQKLWFYYEWTGGDAGHYRLTGTTLRHPRFY